MNEQRNASPDPEADDLQVRQWLNSAPPRTVPSGIELQVLRKVKQRQIAERAVGTGVAAAVLAAAGVGWHMQSPPTSEVASNPTPGAQQRTSGGDPGGFGVNDAELAPMAASPPVASFALVSRNQLALLESLKSLVEE